MLDTNLAINVWRSFDGSNEKSNYFNCPTFWEMRVYKKPDWMRAEKQNRKTVENVQVSLLIWTP